MRAVLAIAVTAFREAIRRRILVSLALFLVVILISAFSLPAPRPEDRAVNVRWVAVIASLAFTNAIAVFISAYGIPDEIRDRRMMTVASKPVRRFGILAGKILGCSAVCIVLQTFLWALVGASLWLAADGTLLPARRVHVADGSPRAELLPAARQSAEAYGRYWLLDAACENSVTYAFSGLRRDMFGDIVDAELFYISQAFNHFDVSLAGQSLTATVTGAQAGEISIPMTVKTGSVRFSFPAAWLAEQGELTIRVRRAPGAVGIGMRQAAGDTDRQGLRLYGKPGSSLLNLGRAFALIALQNCVLVAMTVSASTCMSGPVAVLLGLFFLIAGNLLGFVRESLSRYDVEGGYHAESKPTAGRASGRVELAVDPEARVLQYEAVVEAIHAITRVLPDMSGFNPLPWLEQNLRIDRAPFIHAARATATAALALLAIGWLAFRRREIE